MPFGSNYLKRAIGGLYLAIADHQEVEETYIQNLPYHQSQMHVAVADSQAQPTTNPFTDPTRIHQQLRGMLSPSTTQQQLASHQNILTSLQRQLDEAIHQWSSLPSSEQGIQSEIPWPGFPGPPFDDSESSSSFDSSFSFQSAEFIGNTSTTSGSSGQQAETVHEQEQEQNFWRPRNSADFALDPAFEPDFWRRNGGDRNLWTAPSKRPRDDDYDWPVSPTTVQFGVPCWGSPEGERGSSVSPGPARKKREVDARDIFGSVKYDGNWI
ncbi:hypothetical protein QBC43DRAFT_290642 [Cladorrhinum sp. PSN259]|nr:hypothetical protein QBC43DRAFT_290642 [Cladorrhinum sp. PSN259]